MTTRAVVTVCLWVMAVVTAMNTMRISGVNDALLDKIHNLTVRVDNLGARR